MSQATGDGSTVEWPGASVLAGSEADQGVEVPALTILLHPDVRRVGDRALLSEIPVGREASLSRHQPEFVAPEARSGSGLGDPHVSRSPIRLRGLAEGGIEILTEESRTAVRAHGGAIRRGQFSAEEVRRGVVLEVADRVVVLLHGCELPPSAPPPFGLIGASPALVRVRKDIQRLAELEGPVLLRGETGTGKELVARALHSSSPRRAAGFHAVNLAAIPASLAAADLFGAVRGSYTGAVDGQEGWFRRAHGGTLLLDEVGEAPPEVQVLLLRVLETGEVFPVGSQAARRVDVRLLAATDADLEEKVRAGSFRAPLLHRLNAFEIRLPALRERRDDVGRLLVHFLRQELSEIHEEHRLEAAPVGCPPWLPARVVSELARYDWPGNVRQLRNVVRQLVLASRGLPQLAISRSVACLLGEQSSAATQAPAAPAGAQAVRRKPVEVSEDELLAALRANRWDFKAAAESLHLSRTSLYALTAASSEVRKAAQLSAEEIGRCHLECGGDLDSMAERLRVSRRALGRRLREEGFLAGERTRSCSRS